MAPKKPEGGPVPRTRSKAPAVGLGVGDEVDKASKDDSREADTKKKEAEGEGKAEKREKKTAGAAKRKAEEEAAQEQLAAEQAAAAAEEEKRKKVIKISQPKSTSPAQRSGAASKTTAATRSPIKKKRIGRVAKRQKTHLPSDSKKLPEYLAGEVAKTAKKIWWHIPEGSRAAGLYNAGPHCFRNAAYHTILQIPEIWNMLFQHDYEEHHGNSTEMHLCLCCELRYLQEAYYKINGASVSKKEVDDMSTWLADYRGRLKKAGRDWNDCPDDYDILRKNELHRQQDSADFLMWMLNKMAYRELDKEKRLELKGLFPQMQRTLTCQACGTKKIRQIFEFPPVQVFTTWDHNERERLGDDLKYYLRTHWFRGENMEVRCDNTKCKNQIHAQELRFAATPSYIILKLNVMSSPRGGPNNIKIGESVKIPLWLDLSEFAADVSDFNNSDQLRFKLISTTVHAGSTLNSGHYYGTFTGPKGLRRYDDTRVFYACADHLRNVYARHNDELDRKNESMLAWGDERRDQSRTSTQDQIANKSAFTFDKEILKPEEKPRRNRAGHVTPYVLVYKRFGLDKKHENYEELTDSEMQEEGE